jgi:hypothetical protein
MHFKICLHVDCFFIPAVVLGGKPVARKDLFMHWQDMPSHKCNTFMNTVKLLAEWTVLFNNTLWELELEDLAWQDDAGVEVDDIFNEDEDVAEVRQAHSRGGWLHKIQFSWDLAEEEEPQGSPSPGH